MMLVNLCRAQRKSDSLFIRPVHSYVHLADCDPRINLSPIRKQRIVLQISAKVMSQIRIEATTLFHPIISFLHFISNPYNRQLPQKMVDFTLKGLFMTTSKGIPDLSNLAASVTLTKSTYVYSVLVQCMLLLLFILYFALSIFRVYKKIKNPKFQDVIDHDELTNKSPTERNGENENEKEDKLVYQFDDEEEEEEEPKDADNENPIDKSENLKKEEDKEETAEDDYDEYHDENEESFIQLDNKLLFLQPFFISFIVCNGQFTADALTVILLVLTIVSYILFNIKKKMEHVKAMQFLFMGFSFLAFLSFFYQDHDLAT